MPRNLLLRTRLFVAFGAVLGLTLAVALNGALLARTLFTNGDFYDWNIVPAYEAMHQVIQAAAQLDKEPGTSAALAQQMNQGLSAYAKLVADDEDKHNFADVKTATEALVAAATASPDVLRQAYASFSTTSDRWWKYNQKLSKSYAADSRKEYTDGVALSAGLLLLALIAGAGVAAWLVRSLMRQLGGEPAYAAAVAQSIGAGQLGTRVELRAGDDRSVLYEMERMRAALETIVVAVRQSSDAIAAASSQIADGSADLSQRTEVQASSVEETASAMEQLTAGVKTSADNSRQANELSQVASKTADQGREVMQQVVSRMTNITGSSARIADIVSVIDGIAFQTNILALNAAVEAARAGEQGRGFAVVAGEVRTLAQRSATAAKEVKTLIALSTAEIGKGSELVGVAGDTMNAIVSNVKKVTDLLADISTVASEQSTGLQQIGVVVNQMDSATQQNAALVQESSAAAESLRSAAERLSQVVSVFQVG